MSGARGVDRAEVVEWLTRTKRGYKAAALRFGVDDATVRAWTRDVRGGITESASTPAGWAEMDPEEFLRQSIADIGADLEGARRKESYIAVRDLLKLLVSLRADLAAIERTRADEQPPDDPAALVSELAEILRDLPLPYLEELAPVLISRLGEL